MTNDAAWLDEMPEIYDRCLGPAVFEPYARHVARLVGELAPASVLELAAGTGIVTRCLVEALPDAAVTATDLNPAMVGWAASRIPGATWQVADAQQLPFDAASFDAVVCQFGAMFFPDRPAAYAEARRVLRPDGTLLLTVWDVIERSELPALCEQAVLRAVDGPPPDFMSRIPHGYADPDRIRSDLAAGGLDVDDLEHVVLRGRAESAAAIAEGFCCGTPLRFQLAALGDPKKIAERVAADLTARLGTGPVQGELAAFVITARPSG
jgi:SAM-dependent methyltransferase